MNNYQLAEIEVLKQILAIIDRHNLRYFAIGGTCIGAIRHKGFIPWDDDIDIAMPREDYELLRTVYYKELPSKYQKMDYDISEHYDNLFFKIHDTETTMVDHYSEYQPDRFTGAFVDIMPIDGLPNKYRARKTLFKKMQFLSNLNTWTRLRNVPNKNFLSQKSIVKKYIKKLVIFLFCKCDIPSLIRREFSDYCFDKSKDICFTWRFNMVNLDRIVFRAEWFKETLSVPFENIMINVPKDFDSYLKQDFGDYMILPPDGSRNPVHDSYIYDMTKPCSYYAEIERLRK